METGTTKTGRKIWLVLKIVILHNNISQFGPQTTCMFKDIQPFLFLYTSALCPPGLLIGIWVQSMQPTTLGNSALL